MTSANWRRRVERKLTDLAAGDASGCVARMSTFIWLLLAFLVCVSLAEAQAPKIARIGYVSGTGTASNQGPYVEALRQGLRELGYTEGKNFIIEYRGSEGKPDGTCQ
jgi:hypothetical protein